MEVDKLLFVGEHGHPSGQFLHFHVSKSECKHYTIPDHPDQGHLLKEISWTFLVRTLEDMDTFQALLTF